MSPTAAPQKSSGTSANGQPEQFEVQNPATGETIATLPSLTAEQVAERAARARAAQPAWQELGFAGRGKVFKRAQKWLADNWDRMAGTICSETGKTREDAALEIGVILAATGFWVKHGPKYLADEKLPAVSPFVLGKKVVVRYEPVGVIGVIGPWNYPLANAFGDAIPALIAGNSVLLKPSEVTPMTSLLVAEMMSEAGLPDGVLEVVTGMGPTGAAVVDESDFVMFTGSTATGRKVMERAAQSLTQVSLELGGKDPMIVLADANLERAANGAAYFSMNNGGQVCISVERLYVEEPVYDEFVAKVVDKVKSLRQGVPGAPGSTEIGAVTFDPQMETIRSHVEDAVAKGARVLTGGHAGPGPGNFFEPTVLVDVDHSMTCMVDETFGPTLPIMKVRDAEEAIRLANDSEFGLQGSVWTRDVARGEQIARRIEAGAVCVNDAQVNYGAFNAPMGGWKTSGVGRRHGAYGIRKYCQSQTIMITRTPLKRDLYMFPYSAMRSKLMRRALSALYGRGAKD